MINTPRGLRRHIAIFGKVNAGKSTLFNLLLSSGPYSGSKSHLNSSSGHSGAIVSDVPGTTADPVIKNIELIPFGPATIIDTAGFDDTSELGGLRAEKTLGIARRADLGVFLEDASNFNSDISIDNGFFHGKKLLVFSKCDLISPEALNAIKAKFNDAIFISKNDANSIEALRRAIIDKLSGLELDAPTDVSGIRGLANPGETIVLVIPVDSEAPKGRLILPQAQLIRECIDNGINAFVTGVEGLESAIKSLPGIGLAVTDSQVFAQVDKILPKYIRLTSFSLLLARKSGGFDILMNDVNAVKHLKDGDKLLFLEGCSHNHTHEDIGRVKIPAMLRKFTGKSLEFEFFSGYSFPKALSGYSLAVMCGSCMLNKAEVGNRLEILQKHNIPVTNYGIIIAFLNGILERCVF